MQSQILQMLNPIRVQCLPSKQDKLAKIDGRLMAAHSRQRCKFVFVLEATALNSARLMLKMAENKNVLPFYETVLGTSPLSVVYMGSCNGQPVAIKKVINLSDRVTSDRWPALKHDYVLKVLAQFQSSQKGHIYRYVDEITYPFSI